MSIGKVLKYLVLFLVVMTSTMLYAQNFDSTETIERSISKEKMEDYRSARKFDYQDLERNQENRLKGFIEKIRLWFDKVIGNKASQFIFDKIHYVFIALALFLFIRYYTKSYFIGRHKKGFLVDNVDTLLSEGKIEEIDFDQLVKNALKHKDFNLAMRFQYLTLLKILNQKEIINYQMYKTNHDYQYEIKDAQIRELYTNIYFLFDLVWYGGLTLSEELYQSQNEEYNQLIEKL